MYNLFKAKKNYSPIINHKEQSSVLRGGQIRWRRKPSTQILMDMMI